MRSKLLSIICLIAALFYQSHTKAQTAMNAGDIVVFWVQTDSPDSFAFATFVDLAPGTVIYFSDCGVTLTGVFDPSGCGEGAVQYTVPAGGLSIGDIVIYDSSSPAAEFASYSEPGVINVSFSLSGFGDQVTVFQAAGSPGGSSSAGSNPTFIFIASTASTLFNADGSADNNTTGLPTGLSDIGLPRTALGLGAGPGPEEEHDNSVFQGPYSFSTVNDAKVAMTDPANYTSAAAITDSPYSTQVLFIPSRITITTLSTEELELEESLIMYPNPSSGVVTISNNSIALNSVQVSDMNGRLIKEIECSGRTAPLEMNLSELSTGLYLVRIISTQGSVVKRLMKL